MQTAQVKAASPARWIFCRGVSEFPTIRSLSFWGLTAAIVLGSNLYHGSYTGLSIHKLGPLKRIAMQYHWGRHAVLACACPADRNFGWDFFVNPQTPKQLANRNAVGHPGPVFLGRLW